MYRCVSLILIPMFLLGHGLPHSHTGSSVVEPNGHSLRPHVHVFSGHHHSHDDEEHGDEEHSDSRLDAKLAATGASAYLTVPSDHDSDAIYCSTAGWTVSRSIAKTQLDCPTPVWTLPSLSIVPVLRTGYRFQSLLDRYAKQPIYLLIASLRL